METLTVFAANGNWLLEWKGTPEAAKIARLFSGATALPTPYAILIPVEEVVAALRKVNPQYTVIAAAVTHYLPERFSSRAGNFIPAPEMEEGRKS